MRVILFVFDGLRPDGLQQASTPYVDRLISQGASTYTARTVMPSSTLPCHTSMFRGVTPQRHGILTNTWVPQVRPVPSLVDVLHQAGKRTAFFYNWEQLRDLADPGSLDRSYYMNNCHEPNGDKDLASLAAATLREWTPDFAFVYLGGTDIAGHDHGWMSDGYLAAIGRADTADWHSIGSGQPRRNRSHRHQRPRGTRAHPRHGNGRGHDHSVGHRRSAGIPRTELAGAGEHHRQPHYYCRFARSGTGTGLGRTSGAGSPRIAN